LVTSCFAFAVLVDAARRLAEGTTLMTHIVLLGDSVFDNAPYVASGRDVTSSLRRRLPAGWQATLLAQDGAVLANVHDQAQSLPSDVTHLFVSAGGNDGLRWMGIFDEPVTSVAEALERLAAVRREFQMRYQAMLDEVSASAAGLPLAICTIYDVRFPEPAFREVVLTALTLLNDVITREAGLRSLPLLDLRTLLDEDADFANPIEPSAQGSGKLATAILEVVQEHDFALPRSSIFAGPKPA
jgi:lysophospholipase L1-like esterase